MTDIDNMLSAVIKPSQIKQNAPMKEYTTFKAGGNADYFVSPQSTEEITDIIMVCRKNGIPYYVLGNGSNVLVKDEGFKGVVISTRKLNHIELVSNNIIKAQSGAVLAKIANFALDNDLAGLEFASGIPGTLGGAVYMNAGAYGGEIADIFENASVLMQDGEIETLYIKDMDFAYRTSRVQSEGLLVLDASVYLEKGDYMQIKDKMLELNKRRADKQPLDLPSAGSAFKRPIDTFAGKLIMEAGLSGYSIGGAQISEKHCGFIVNTGNATASDIIKLVDYVQEIVFDKAGIALEPEFRIIGS